MELQEIISFVWSYYRDSEKPPRLKEGVDPTSEDLEDYEFGLTVEEVEMYTKWADLLHCSMVFCYGPKSLTPYMIKLIDFVPKFLQTTPVKSMMRLVFQTH